jgi:hypothetical protein
MFGLHDSIFVPMQYIIPIPPTMDQLKVVVISGELLGNDYMVAKYAGVHCRLKKVGKRGSGVEVTLPSDTLCLI